MRNGSEPAPSLDEQPTGGVGSESIGNSNSLLVSLHKTLGPPEHNSAAEPAEADSLLVSLHKTLGPSEHDSPVEPAEVDSLLVSRAKALGTSEHTSPPVEPAVAAYPPGPPPIVTVRRRHSKWLLAVAFVLAALLITASVIAVQQHNVASKWMNDYNAEAKNYHAEAKNYHAEVHKNAALYATLLSTQSQLSAVARDSSSR